MSWKKAAFPEISVLQELLERQKPSKEHLFHVLKILYLTRFSDNKMNILVKQNKGTSFFLSVRGHELIGAVASQFIRPKIDWAFPYYRDRAFMVGLGAELVDLFAAFLGRDITNHSATKLMLDHFSHKELRVPVQSSVVGAQFLQAAGVAKAIQYRDPDRNHDEIVYVSAGDGATSQGDFHEALNFSSIHRLGIIFVIQDNGYAISVPSREQTAGASIAKMASGYAGLACFDIDGTDYEQLSSAMQKAVKKARTKEGPSLIVAKVSRLSSHTSSDDQTKYKDAFLLEEEKKRDPIPLFEQFLLKHKSITQEEIQTIQEEAQKEVQQAAAVAETIPPPHKEKSSIPIFKEYHVTTPSSSVSSEPVVMMDAVAHALKEEMQRDSSIVVFGEDVGGKKGGVFGITRQLTELFGEMRCFNTPLAESTIVGIAIGMSLTGYVIPVAEIQFMDFAWPAMNQLVNELASIHYRSNGQWHCPLVIRMPYGGYIQGGPYHSQSIESVLCHMPGLKVVIPSNSADAKRLLKTALKDPNPVIFLEHKALYRQRGFAAQREPDPDNVLPFGKAKIVQEGQDLTIVTWGLMVSFALDVAKKLKEENISIEVIDLRTLVPLDMQTLLTSVKKTSKLLIVHEAAKTCGFGAEIVARINFEGFAYLDAPIMRVAAKDCPIPYALELEQEVLPQKDDIEQAARELYHF